jgi:hypothetical protein
MERNDSGRVEKRVVGEREVPQTAKGGRLVISVGLMVLGAALIAIGIWVVSVAAVRIALILGGIVLLVVNGNAAMAGKKTQVGVSKEGVDATTELPQDEKVETTVYRQDFPKHGQMPSKRGRMPGRSRRSQ